MVALNCDARSTAPLARRRRPTVAPSGQLSTDGYEIRDEVRTYIADPADTDNALGPVQVSRTVVSSAAHTGTVPQWKNYGKSYTETFTIAGPVADVATATFTAADLSSLTRTYTNTGGQTIETRQYFDLSGQTYTTAPDLGAAGTNYLRTEYDYVNQRGWLNRVTSPDGTVTRTIYDLLGRVTGTWVGTNDISQLGGQDRRNLGTPYEWHCRPNSFVGGLLCHGQSPS